MRTIGSALFAVTFGLLCVGIFSLLTWHTIGQTRNFSTSSFIAAESPQKIIYRSVPSADRHMLRSDCARRGGVFHACSAACTPEHAICTGGCAPVCEMLPAAEPPVVWQEFSDEHMGISFAYPYSSVIDVTSSTASLRLVYPNPDQETHDSYVAVIIHVLRHDPKIPPDQIVADALGSDIRISKEDINNVKIPFAISGQESYSGLLVRIGHGKAIVATYQTHPESERLAEITARILRSLDASPASPESQ